MLLSEQSSVLEQFSDFSKFHNLVVPGERASSSETSLSIQEYLTQNGDRSFLSLVFQVSMTWQMLSEKIGDFFFELTLQNTYLEMVPEGKIYVEYESKSGRKYYVLCNRILKIEGIPSQRQPNQKNPVETLGFFVTSLANAAKKKTPAIQFVTNYFSRKDISVLGFLNYILPKNLDVVSMSSEKKVIYSPKPLPQRAPPGEAKEVPKTFFDLYNFRSNKKLIESFKPSRAFEDLSNKLDAYCEKVKKLIEGLVPFELTKINWNKKSSRNKFKSFYVSVVEMLDLLEEGEKLKEILSWVSKHFEVRGSLSRKRSALYSEVESLSKSIELSLDSFRMTIETVKFAVSEGFDLEDWHQSILENLPLLVSKSKIPEKEVSIPLRLKSAEIQKPSRLERFDSKTPQISRSSKK